MRATEAGPVPAMCGVLMKKLSPSTLVRPSLVLQFKSHCQSKGKVFVQGMLWMDVDMIATGGAVSIFAPVCSFGGRASPPQIQMTRPQLLLLPPLWPIACAWWLPWQLHLPPILPSLQPSWVPTPLLLLHWGVARTRNHALETAAPHTCTWQVSPLKRKKTPISTVKAIHR